MGTITLSRWQFYTALAVLAVCGLLVGGALATWLRPEHAEWWLERKHPDRWGRRETHTGAG